MKKLFFLNFLAVALVFSSCSSDDNGDQIISECEIATAAALAAKQDYESATNEQYVAACNAYKTALENQQAACGDADGSIQDIIDSLGDCPDPAGNGADGEISLRAGSMEIVFDQVTIVEESGILKVSGGNSGAFGYTIYFEVEAGAEGDDVFQNFEIMLTSLCYPVESHFHNTVATNVSGTLTGTFYGIVQNDDGGQLELNNGTFDLSY